MGACVCVWQPTIIDINFQIQPNNGTDVRQHRGVLRDNAHRHQPATERRRVQLRVRRFRVGRPLRLADKAKTVRDVAGRFLCHRRCGQEKFETLRL